MKKNILLFFSVFILYAFVDVAYQLLIGLKAIKILFPGSEDIFSKNIGYPQIILLFFIIISYANLRLCVFPAIKEKSILKAVINGYSLGVAAYSTFALPMLWLIEGYPISLAFLTMLAERSFSMISSGLVVYIYLSFVKIPSK